MPTYKFKYFNVRGSGEVCRLLFALAGQEYEDVRFTQDTWPAEKSNTPFGQMPVLEIDGKSFAQSGAISRYLAKKFGFYGTGELEELQVEQVMGILQDLMVVLIRVYFEKDEKNKEALMKEAREEKLPMYMKMLEKILDANGGTGYFVGNKISLPDVSVFDFGERVQKMFTVNLDDYPLVKKCREVVGSDPKVKAWLAKRPVTEN